MKGLPIGGAALAASLALAACGGGGTDSVNTSSAGGGGDTVAVKQVDGVGKVLVDANGMALYASNVEADGQVKCVDACVSFWKPLTVSQAKPTAGPGVGKLAVVKRPDGSRQVTADGHLLYTFADDAAGQIKGIGFQDDFQGRHFTWKAVLAGGGLASRSGSSSSGSSSGGSDNGYPGGGYNGY
jgi:predicted lipoprotein with Yx(FWY)xxD motif